jgi:GTPase involved in cell partitioning and DNA repair
VLAILIDSLSPDPARDLAALRHELSSYHEDLERKPAVVVMSRADLSPSAPTAEQPAPFPLHGARWGGSISGATGAGTRELLEIIWTMLAGGDEPRPEGWERGDAVAKRKE